MVTRHLRAGAPDFYPDNCTAGSDWGVRYKGYAQGLASTIHNLDHDLLMRAVRKHTDCKWIILYVERWLKAPAQLEDGTLINREKGTPQGGVISPLLANLFLHYALDEWMGRDHPDIEFERYADDAVFHCVTEREAKALKMAIGERLAECRLELHPEKTKIVYCKSDSRRGNYPNEKFDFLGYTFRPRR